MPGLVQDNAYTLKVQGEEYQINNKHLLERFLLREEMQTCVFVVALARPGPVFEILLPDINLYSSLGS